MDKNNGKDTKHVDTVFDLAAVKEIEEARDAGGYATTSAWMRAAVEYVLRLRRKAGSEDFIVILDKDEKIQSKVQADEYNFLRK